MANINVHLPGGSIKQYSGVPDDVTPDAIIARAQKDFGVMPVKVEKTQPITQDTPLNLNIAPERPTADSYAAQLSATDDAPVLPDSTGWAKLDASTNPDKLATNVPFAKYAAGFTRNFESAATGLKQIAANPFGYHPPGVTSSDYLQQLIDKEKQQEQSYQENTKGSIQAGLGRFAGGVIEFMGPGEVIGGVTKIPALATRTGNFLGNLAKSGAQRAVTGSIQGATGAAVAPVSEGNSAEFDKNKLIQTGEGAGMGAVLNTTLAPVAESIINKGKNIVGNVVNAFGGNVEKNPIPVDRVIKDAVAKDSRAAGLVIPTALTNPDSTTNQVLESAGGVAAMKAAASAKNQPVLNSMIRQEFGMPDDKPLTIGALDSVRSAAAAPYRTLNNYGDLTADKQYLDGLNNIKNEAMSSVFDSQKSKDIANLADDYAKQTVPSKDAVKAIRQLRADSSLNIKSDDPETVKTGRAQIEIANQMEDLIERNLQNNGNQDLLNQYRNARQTIAKTYSTQEALTQGGDIDAHNLADQLDKGAPLSGNLAKIAKFASIYPDAAKVNKVAPPPIGLRDIFTAAAASAVTHNPLAAGAVLAGPAARTVSLSQPYQRLMGTPNYGYNIQVPDFLSGLPAAAANQNPDYFKLLQAEKK